MYTALYRAERPEVFDEILGQEHIVKILRHQIALGHGQDMPTCFAVRAEQERLRRRESLQRV